LRLVKLIVEMHGGRITAHSEGVGHGCRFEVRLPLVATAAASHERLEA
jgi:two-component system CheB/CheR fusion protein